MLGFFTLITQWLGIALLSVLGSPPRCRIIISMRLVNLGPSKLLYGTHLGIYGVVGSESVETRIYLLLVVKRFI